MKRFLVGAVMVLAAFILFAAEVSAADWWIVGTVKGSKTQDEVITLRLVPKGEPVENYVEVTSTNKYDQYAFSRPETGPASPGAYKLVIYVGFDRVMEVPLDNVKSGGRVPPITLTW
jgi:hypothetical protein